jgi:hypothetical protein
MRINGTNDALEGPDPRGARRRFRLGRQIASESQEIRFGGVGPPALLEFRFVELEPHQAGVATRVRPGAKVMSCKECERLLRQQCDAADRWRELLKTLSNSAVSRESGIFGSAWDQASRVQSQVASARNAYRLHLATHRPEED